MLGSSLAGEDRRDGRSDEVLGPVEIEVRYEALNWASQQFASNYVRLGEVLLGVQRACTLAAPATGDGGAEAGVVAFCDRATAALDDAWSRLVDVAGGLRGAVETYQAADGLKPAPDQEPTRHLGGPR
jgi:hypothetical protein